MAANVENLGTLERRVSMSVPVRDIEKQVDARLKQLARNVKMPGFRPGKVPMKIVAQTYGPQVRNEVLGDAVQKSFSDAVKEANLRVAGYPKIEKKEEKQAEAFHRASAAVESARFRVLMIDTAAWIETGDWTHNSDASISALRGSPIATVAATPVPVVSRRYLFDAAPPYTVTVSSPAARAMFVNEKSSPSMRRSS